MIFIIRAERVCIWGSVYLDCFGEEDRDLRLVGLVLVVFFRKAALLLQIHSVLSLDSVKEPFEKYYIALGRRFDRVDQPTLRANEYKIAHTTRILARFLGK